MHNLPGLAVVEGEGSLAAAAVVVRAAGDGDLLLLAGGPAGDGLAGGGAHVLEVAFAGEVGAAGFEGRGIRVVDVAAAVGVALVSQGRGVGHVHVGGGEAGGREDGESGCECLHFEK